MKKLLKLSLLEASFLKRTLVVIFVIFTAFGAAFLAVISVMLDTPRGMIAGIDASKQYYVNLYGGECFALQTENRSADFAERYSACLCYGTLAGATFDAELRRDDAVFLTDLVTQLGNGDHKLEYRVERHGYFIPRQYASRAQFGLPQNAERGIWLCSEIASALGVRARDEIFLGDRRLSVLGVYERGGVIHSYAEDEPVLPSAWFYVVDNAENAVFDTLYLAYTSTRDIFDVWQRADENLRLSDILTQWHEDIALVQTYYGYLAILLGALILFLLYALFALLYRSRKAQMCRFALLGATGATATFIYAAIALGVILCATVLASAFSVVLSKFLLRVCTRLFNVTYPYRFRVWLPFALLGGCVLVVGITFVWLHKRMSRLPIAQEVRHE